MRYVQFGNNKRISKIGLGTAQFGSTTWGYGESYSRRDAHAIIRRAIELGITLFDTAEIYSSGASERILGETTANDQESIILATKIFPVVPSAWMVKWRAKASMARLQSASIDLYQVHWPNPFVPDAAIMRGMRSLRRAGFLSEVGVSKYSLDRWLAADRALGDQVLTNQVEYSLLDRSPERELIPFARTHGRIIIAFSPLAHGLLSGRYNETSRPAAGFRSVSPSFQPENLARIEPLLNTLREIADAHSASPAQIALAWTIHDPAVVAIPGASSVDQLESNVFAAEIKLADDEYMALSAASAKACRSEESYGVRRRLVSDLKQLTYSRYVLKATLSDYRMRRK